MASTNEENVLQENENSGEFFIRKTHKIFSLKIQNYTQQMLHAFLPIPIYIYQQ